MSSVDESAAAVEPGQVRPGAARVVRREVPAWVWPATAVVVLIMLWEFAVLVFDIPEFVLPTPTEILDEGWAKRSVILDNGLATLVSVVAGFAIAAALAIPLALAVVYWPTFERTIYPLLVASQTVPKIAVVPLLVVWFGFGQVPKLVLATLISFFPIVIDSAIGLRSISPSAVDLIRSLGGGKREVFRFVRIPASLPYVFSGLKIGITLAVVGAVVGEFVGSTRGLGVMIVRASGVLNTRLVFAGIIALGVLGIVLFYIVVFIERLTTSWHETQRTTAFTM